MQLATAKSSKRNMITNHGICQKAYGLKQTVGFSYDDAGMGDLARKTAILYDIPQEKWPEYMEWYAEHYPYTNVTFRDTPDSA